MSSNTLVRVTANAGEAPTITPPSGDAPTALIAEDIIVGSGTEVVATSTVTLHYTLMKWSDGSILESSWSSGTPSTFQLSGLIQGWQQGLPGAKVGGRRLLVLPTCSRLWSNGWTSTGEGHTHFRNRHHCRFLSQGN